MAGIFGLFDYTKEGKGVYPDEPPKGPVLAFFAILGRKFWKICTINLMYVLFSLPALILAFFGASFVLGILVPGLDLEALAKVFADAGITLNEGVSFEEYVASQMIMAYFTVGMTLTGLGLIVIGPVHAGVTYLLRNYSREEHAFIWMDFKEHAGKNLKQSLISSLIGLVVIVLLFVNFAFYNSSSIIGSPILRTVIKTILAMLLGTWCIVQMYLYPMMVTFDLSLKQLYKNSFLFVMLRLPLNILILLLSALILFVLPAILLLIGMGGTILLAILWYALLAFGLNLLLTNFFAYRGLDKFMISQIKAAEEMNEETDLAAADLPDSTAADEGEPEEKPQQDNKGGGVQAPSPTRP
jgi:uncharacterized membrane protein YesL